MDKRRKYSTSEVLRTVAAFEGVLQAHGYYCDEKTKHIVEMHDNLILSMAMMVESRDNSTGGHIRRTSENVRILIDEIKKSGDLQLNEEFCKDIIKAAPMHDIGKIAVDDEVLRKPGRFTPEEYEKMKEHSAQGARIVHEILKDTDDESFKELSMGMTDDYSIAIRHGSTFIRIGTRIFGERNYNK